MMEPSASDSSMSAATPAAPDLSENALRVLRARYLMRDEDGRLLESPADLFRRVARAVAAAEIRYEAAEHLRQVWEERFYELMVSRRFLPNSPTLMNAGRPMGMLSACFVLPVGDSIEEIFDAIKHVALIQRAGGGTGLAFDRLRPSGDFIRGSGGTTSGPISFWRAFAEASQAIQQGAFRRGANMGMMYIHHPDILKFLHAKQDLESFTNYNISVKVPDQWMAGLRADPDQPHLVINPRTGRGYYLPRDLNPTQYDIHALLPATPGHPPARPCYRQRDLWDVIVHQAWQTGEPGLVFIDRLNADNPTPHIGRIEATNPCGEQPLLDYEACNLGSINLAWFVRGGDLDWEALAATVDLSVRFLDDVIDVNKYPLPEVENISRANRKIGLGVMGFADMLFRLNVPYDSEAGVAWGEHVMRFINERAHQYSQQLAEQRGCFPNWSGSRWETTHHRPMRNACCTSVAPTGTLSIIAGCSSGIEPVYALVFRRHVLREHAEQEPMIEVNPVLESALKQAGLFTPGLLERIARSGSVQPVTELPDDLRRVFVTALDIAPAWHVRMQAAFQRHCDAAVSKTVNLPAGATTQDVAAVFQLAYDLGCKGVTVYRDRCRPQQPMRVEAEGCCEVV